MVLTLMLAVVVGQSAPNEALHKLDTGNATAKAKQEAKLEAVEKALRQPLLKCPKCPACVAGAAADDLKLEVHVIEVKADALEVSGTAELWKKDPPPPEKLGEAPFATPLPPLAVTPPPEPKLPLWAWMLIAGGIGLTVGGITGGIIGAVAR